MYKDLPLSDRARIIQMAVQSGIKDLRTIEDVYNKFEDGGPTNKSKKRFDKPVSWYVSQKPELYPTINKIRPEYLDKYFIINDAGQIEENTARQAFINRKKEVRGTTGSIPYNQDNEIMLTTNGANARYRTGRISTDLLDYIYDNAAKAGIPFRDAVGLAGKESTLGIGRGYKRGASVSPIDLYSFWNGVGDGVRSNKWHNDADKLYKSLYAGDELDMETFNKVENEYRKLYDNLHEFQGDNLVKDAYNYYKAGKYNPGEKEYNTDVITQGDAILSDPAVQKWLKTKKAYSGRGFAAGGPIKNLAYKTMIDDTIVHDSDVYDFNPIDYNYTSIQYASGGKIHIKKENRGKFTALKKRTGHSASWFKAHGTPAQRKMATFALNARKWHH